MKRKLISLFLAIFMLAFAIMPYSVGAGETNNIAVESVEKAASQLVDVKITATQEIDVNTAKLVIDYDDALELVSVTNGTLLPGNYSLGVNEQDRGSYTLLVGVSNPESDVYLAAGDVICTLKFKTPSTEGAYNVTVNSTKTQLVSANATVTPCIAKVGTITVTKAPDCSAHTFGADVVVSQAATYFTGAYSYKSCTACGYVESTITPPTATNILTPLGTAIRYAGNPSGIGAHFGVNVDAITAIEALGYKVEIGIEIEYGNRTQVDVFYGSDVPPANATNFADGVISSSIEGIHTQQEGTICGYVKIMDPAKGGSGRYERVYTHLNGDKYLSIKDIASVLNFNKYSQASADYLTAVMAGETFEDRNLNQ